ncbi:hypothetical protein [Nostoc sp.]
MDSNEALASALVKMATSPVKLSLCAIALQPECDRAIKFLGFKKLKKSN